MPIKLTKFESARIHQIQRKAHKGKVSYTELRYCTLLKRRADAYFECQQRQIKDYYDRIQDDDALSCAQPAYGRSGRVC